tara:strand:- start:3211 stop:3441 length:231 start_codon:yes stop_codon:yes gene_type:complete
LTPSKAAFLEAAFFEALAGTAGAEVVSAELFFQNFMAVDNSQAPFDLLFGRISPTAFAHRLKKMAVRCGGSRMSAA